MAAQTARSTTEIAAILAEVQNLVVRTIRSSTTHVDRREAVRIELHLPCKITVGEMHMNTETHDVSQHGAAVVCAVRFRGHESTPFTVVAHDNQLPHMRLHPNDGKWLERLGEVPMARAA